MNYTKGTIISHELAKLETPLYSATLFEKKERRVSSVMPKYGRVIFDQSMQNQTNNGGKFDSSIINNMSKVQKLHLKSSLKSLNWCLTKLFFL